MPGCGELCHDLAGFEPSGVLLRATVIGPCAQGLAAVLQEPISYIIGHLQVKASSQTCDVAALALAGLLVETQTMLEGRSDALGALAQVVRPRLALRHGDAAG